MVASAPGRVNLMGDHTDYQDGSAFLEAGGHRGPQFDVLKPGTYYINPLMFNVTLDDVGVVQRGEVAVLVSNVGKEPPAASDDRLTDARERYVVPAGYRGMAIGKWHLGARAGYHPLDRGFDEFFGFLTGGNAFITTRTPKARATASDGEARRFA